MVLLMVESTWEGVGGGFRSCQGYNTQVVGVKGAHLIHSSAIIDGADPTVFQTHRQL
jgi:hypothetical protein